MSKKHDSFESWAKFLNPETLKNNLIRISIYICGYEVLKDSIISQIKTFYWTGYDRGKDIISENYSNRFQGKKTFDESLNWLIEHGAITIEDKGIVLELTRYRNELAHEMAKYIGTTEKEVKDEYFQALYIILTKIERWWFMNVELDVNPMLENIGEIKEEDVQTSSMIMLQLLHHVYTGNDKELESLYNIFMEKMKEKE